MLHGMLLTAYCYVLHGMLHAALSALHNYCVLHGMLCAALLCCMACCMACAALCCYAAVCCCAAVCSHTSPLPPSLQPCLLAAACPIQSRLALLFFVHLLGHLLSLHSNLIGSRLVLPTLQAHRPLSFCIVIIIIIVTIIVCIWAINIINIKRTSIGTPPLQLHQCQRCRTHRHHSSGHASDSLCPFSSASSV